jgi:hypothetical protein
MLTTENNPAEGNINPCDSFYSQGTIDYEREFFSKMDRSMHMSDISAAEVGYQ